jgi:hypothetical protein
MGEGDMPRIWRILRHAERRQASTKGSRGREESIIEAETGEQGVEQMTQRLDADVALLRAADNLRKWWDKNGAEVRRHITRSKARKAIAVFFPK